jgi:hypothetical protein
MPLTTLDPTPALVVMTSPSCWSASPAALP